MRPDKAPEAPQPVEPPSVEQLSVEQPLTTEPSFEDRVAEAKQKPVTTGGVHGRYLACGRATLQRRLLPRSLRRTSHG